MSYHSLDEFMDDTGEAEAIIIEDYCHYVAVRLFKDKTSTSYGFNGVVGIFTTFKKAQKACERDFADELRIINIEMEWGFGSGNTTIPDYWYTPQLRDMLIQYRIIPIDHMDVIAHSINYRRG